MHECVCVCACIFLFFGFFVLLCVFFLEVTAMSRSFSVARFHPLIYTLCHFGLQIPHIFFFVRVTSSRHHLKKKKKTLQILV